MTTDARVAHPSNLLLAYVDESCTTDRFYLGPVVVDGAAAARIEAGLDLILQDYRGQFGLGASTEMHGNPLFGGKDGWGAVPTRVRINVYERAMGIVGTSGARVVLRGMNVRRQRERYADPHPPHEIVLGHLLERVNEYAREHEAQALVLADQVHAEERHRTNFHNSLKLD